MSEPPDDPELTALLADVRAFLPELRAFLARTPVTAEDRQALADVRESIARLHRALLEGLVAGTPDEAELVRTLLGQAPEARA